MRNANERAKDVEDGQSSVETDLEAVSRTISHFPNYLTWVVTPSLLRVNARSKAKQIAQRGTSLCIGGSVRKYR
jgi:hypothetical protein